MVFFSNTVVFLSQSPITLRQVLCYFLINVCLLSYRPSFHLITKRHLHHGSKIPSIEHFGGTLSKKEPMRRPGVEQGKMGLKSKLSTIAVSTLGMKQIERMLCLEWNEQNPDLGASPSVELPSELSR